MIKCNKIPSMQFYQSNDKIGTAITTIQKGLCKRIDVSEDVKVYACKNIIRIDIKWEEQNNES